MIRLAILITCFNRREQTLNCLNSLFKLKKDIDVYLVDDNSNDGTYDAVSNQFPEVNIIKGNGNLFWNRGMHLAWENALQKDYNYYLWLNDDVLLYENCFVELFDCLNFLQGKAVISGVIETQDKSKIIYGGFDKNKNIIAPNGKLKEIINLNGNVVLIPRVVFHILGNLDPIYHHDLGDVDYGLRAKKQKIKVLTTRVPIGSGQVNDLCRVRQKGVTLKKRFKKLYSPLGSNPNIGFYFRKKHNGYINAIIYYLFIHFLNVLSDRTVHLIFKGRY